MQFWVPRCERHRLSSTSSGEAIGVEQSPCEERLGKLGLFSLDQSWSWGDLTAAPSACGEVTEEAGMRSSQCCNKLLTNYSTDETAKHKIICLGILNKKEEWRIVWKCSGIQFPPEALYKSYLYLFLLLKTCLSKCIGIFLRFPVLFYLLYLPSSCPSYCQWFQILWICCNF